MLNQRTIFTSSTHSFGRLARQAAMCIAVAALTACGGGSSGSGNIDMVIEPLAVYDDPPRSVDEALQRGAVPPRTTVRVSPLSDGEGDPHVSISVSEAPIMSELMVSSNGDETLTPFAGDGSQLPYRRGSIIVTVTADLIAKGGVVIIRVSDATGEVTLTSALLPPSDTPTPTSTTPTI